MDIFSICVIGMIGAVLSLVLVTQKAEIAFIISLVTSIIILLSVLGGITEIFSFVYNIINRTNIDVLYIQIIIKCVGVCYITQICSDICRDFNQSGIASKIELFGKVSVLVISMPVFIRIFELIEGLIW